MAKKPARRFVIRERDPRRTFVRGRYYSFSPFHPDYDRSDFCQPMTRAEARKGVKTYDKAIVCELVEVKP